MGITHKFRSLFNLVALSWKYRATYADTSSAFNAFFLRAAIGNLGGKILRPSEVTLRIKENDDPVYLRRPSSDFQIFKSIFEDGEYDVVKELNLGDAPVIFDLGGNVGFTVRRIAMFLPKAKFLSVEPDFENRKMLIKNNRTLIDSNQLTVIEGFVATKEGYAAIDRSDGVASMFHMRDARDDDSELIPCHTIESLMRKVNVNSIDLLKVDIEGAEAQLFANCQNWISRVRHIIVEVDPPYTYDKLHADLKEAGWQFEVKWQKTSVTCLKQLSKSQPISGSLFEKTRA